MRVIRNGLIMRNKREGSWLRLGRIFYDQSILKIRITILLHLSISVSGCFDWKTQLNIETQIQRQQGNLQGIGLVIVSDDEVIFKKGFGYADSEEGRKVTPQTLFRVGSISKLFTATAIMQLAEQELLDIDQPVTTYLPDFYIQTRPDLVSDVDSITVRHMLTHHSGISSDYFHSNYQEFPPSLAEYAAQFKIETMAQDPGTYWSYSNAATTILGRVVEIVSGESFSDFIQQHITDSLNMNESSFDVSDIVRGNLAIPYAYNPESEAQLADRHYAIAEIPAGSFMSNLNDMGKFMQSVLSDVRGSGGGHSPLLSQATYETMFTSQNAGNPFDQLLGVNMGLGWFLNEHPAGLIVTHGGDINSFHNQLLVMPEHNLAVYATTNSDNGVEIIRGIAKRALELALQRERGISWEEVIVDEPTTLESIDWTQDQLEKFVGFYNNPANNSLFKLQSDGTMLFVEEGDQIITIQAMSDGSVRVKDSNGNLVFGESTWLRDVSDKTIFSVGNLHWVRFEPVTIPPEWQQRLGHYIGETSIYDLFTGKLIGTFTDEVELTMDDGNLVAVLNEDTDDSVAIVAYDANRAYVPGIGRGSNEAVFFDEQGRLRAFGLILYRQETADESNIVRAFSFDQDESTKLSIKEKLSKPNKMHLLN